MKLTLTIAFSPISFRFPLCKSTRPANHGTDSLRRRYIYCAALYCVTHLYLLRRSLTMSLKVFHFIA
jgi:hypothetical protein